MGEKSVLYSTEISTPLGPMVAVIAPEGLCLLEFADRRLLKAEIKDLQKRYRAQVVSEEGPLASQLRTELAEYFSGRRKKFTVPLATPGSEFQNQVWGILQTIPYGETRSYRDQAVAIGKPKAVRAVARANGMNRIAIVIPCHRVIGSSGQLVGYSGGLARKKYLLDLENGPSAP